VIRRRDPGSLPATHVIARISLGGFVALLFLAALLLAVFWRGHELALERIVADVVKSWLLP
jgi:hypothetical protein